MTSPLVTCILLTKWPDRRDMLRDALASFHAQTYGARELLVVNEGLPLESTVPGVRVLNTGPKGTLGGQRNLGLLHAQGEYVATWDDDDLSLPERLTVQVVYAGKHRADHVVNRRYWLADAALSPTCIVTGAGNPTALTRRVAALWVEGYGEVNYGEDAILWSRLGEAQARIRALWTPLYVHRRHGANISTALAGETHAQWSAACEAAVRTAREAIAAAIDQIRAGYSRPLLRDARSSATA